MEIDRKNLEEVFNSKDEEKIKESMDDIINNEDIDAEESLEKNIKKANIILDIVYNELTNGNFSARLVEVASQMLNAVTNASKEILSTNNYEKYLQVRNKMVELKRAEIELKKSKSDKPNSQNIIVTDRESILQILNNEKPKQIAIKEKDGKNE
jgi:hypothetical protein